MTHRSQPVTGGVPVLPIRDRVVFPGIHVALVVGRPRSIQTVRWALTNHQAVFVVAQRHVKVEEPSRGDLFEYGTLAEVLQSTDLPEGLVRIRVIGRSRARLIDMAERDGVLMGDVVAVQEPSVAAAKALELEAMRRMVVAKFDEYAKKMSRIPAETVARVSETPSLDGLADGVADSLLISVEEKQDLLETLDLSKRFSRLIELLNAEIEILQIEKKIQTRVHRQIERSQKEYYLNEQMRAIQKELKKKEDLGKEVDDMREKIKESKMGEESE
jgi:ATP-dependent Lon protease